VKDWHLGQRCVCIRDFSGEARAYPAKVSWPVKDQILTIRGIDKRISNRGSEVLGLLFEEITNPILLLSDGTTREPAFGDWDFRPLDESRLDQFRAHLNPKSVEEKMDA
jgi:hypothetical protein